MTHQSEEQPRRGLQLYSAENQAQFSGMTAAQRLAWLDEIRLLYWKGEIARQGPDARGR